MTTKLLQALTIALLFVSGAAIADPSIQVSVVNGQQQAKFSIGDSKCVLVGEAIRCVPTLVASN